MRDEAAEVQSLSEACRLPRLEVSSRRATTRRGGKRATTFPHSPAEDGRRGVNRRERTTSPGFSSASLDSSTSLCYRLATNDNEKSCRSRTCNSNMTLLLLRRRRLRVLFESPESLGDADCVPRQAGKSNHVLSGPTYCHAILPIVWQWSIWFSLQAALPSHVESSCGMLQALLD